MKSRWAMCLKHNPQHRLWECSCTVSGACEITAVENKNISLCRTSVTNEGLAVLNCTVAKAGVMCHALAALQPAHSARLPHQRGGYPRIGSARR
jgi:hypothetical protein